MRNPFLMMMLTLTAGTLSIFASPRSDREIEEAVHKTYVYHEVLNDEVEATAKDGVVTLSGTLQDAEEKTLAEDTAANLKGVVRVVNEITLDPTIPESSDAWIAFKIRARLLMRSNVSATATDVAVLEGVVTLTGSADNLAQKELTGIYAAEIEGVKSVENNLVVETARAKSEEKTETIDDASITSQVKLALSHHQSTKTISTRITTNGGVVVITGVADSDAEKSLVTKLVRDIRGVKSVHNNMTIKS